MDDRDAPNILVPKLPGTAIMAGLGGLLFAVLGVVLVVNWANGTLEDRLRVESKEDHTEVGWLARSSASEVGAAVRLTVMAPVGQELPVSFFESSFKWEALGPDMWRWPSGGPEGASTVVLEDNVLVASPVRLDLAEMLSKEARSMGLIVESEPLDD